ncbi:MAG: hypothetical protein IJE19_00015 [Clostridia bacterium]|nr:hypothetical protein [Clostridia bacterium]
MKKILNLILCILLCFAHLTTAFADEISSPPMVMFPDYKTDCELRAGGTAKISITLTNRSKSDYVKNMKLTFSDTSGDIVPVGVTSGYVDRLNAKKSVTWDIDVKISETAADGNHAVNIMCEFESEAGSGSSSDVINLSVIGKKEIETTSAPQDTSQPRLMVTEYTVENGSIIPGESRKVSITIKNTSPSKSVSNIKLSLADESGELKTDGMGTAYVKSIPANGTYVWDVGLTAVHTAKTGEHPLTLSMEYEDSNHSGYSASDTIRVNIKQSVMLKYDSARLPSKSIQGETVTVSINLMNTGKSTIHNAMIDVDVKGLDSGGTVLVGEILQGESKTGSVNLRVSNEILGKVEGVITINYEDDFGETYTETVDVSTVIEEKVIKADTEEEEEKKNPLWWLFMLVGAIIGGLLGFGIPHAIRSNKQRKEDEKRL